MRRSRRSAYISVAAATLCDAGFATLVFDGLTSDEKGSALAPDSSEIARRLAAATSYLSGEQETAELAVGYLATSAGAEGPALQAGIAGRDRLVWGPPDPDEQSGNAYAALRSRR